jgi:hypothetical protein
MLTPLWPYLHQTPKQQKQQQQRPQKHHQQQKRDFKVELQEMKM